MKTLCKGIFLFIFLLFAKSAFGQNPSELYKMARHFDSLSNYATSLKYYNQILSLLPPDETFIDDRIFYLRPYTERLLQMGGYQEVENLLRDSIYSNDGTLQINLASALGYQEKYTESLSLFDEISKRGFSTSITRRALQNEGYIYSQMGDFENALLKYTEALPYFSSYDRNVVESNMAMCLAHLGRFPEAYHNISNAINGLKKGGEQTQRDYIRALRKYAEIYFLNHNYAEALSKYKAYFLLERNWLIDNLPRLSTDYKLSLWRSEKSLLSSCFILEDYAPDFLFDVALFRRQTSLLGVHDVNNLCESLTVASKEIRNRLKNNEVAIEFVSYIDDKGLEQYAAIILPHRGNARFIKLFNVDYIFEPEVVGANSIFNVIKHDNFVEKNQLYSDSELANKVWSPIIASLPTTASKIYFAPEGIFHFWGIENMPFDGKDKYELYRITSTASLINNDHNDHQPNAALVVGGLNYSSLPNDYSSVLPNHDAADVLARKVGKNNVFNYLAGTRIEADTVSNTLKHARPLYNVGEAEIKKILPDFDLIHIATHGYSLNMGIKKHLDPFSENDSIDVSMIASGLALSGANILYQYSDREDGLLSAREICDLDLSNVDFVVLSACQTAQGDLTDEGAAGLVRGLKNAGVKTIMATLWSVDDKSTMLFMQEFYKLLEQGKSKHDAYVGAQNFLKQYELKIPYRKFSPATLARENRTLYHTTKFDAPYYWAPFILIDDF